MRAHPCEHGGFTHAAERPRADPAEGPRRRRHDIEDPALRVQSRDGRDARLGPQALAKWIENLR